MAKYKIKYVKYVFNHKLYRGERWAETPPAEHYFGNRYTETLNSYQFNQNYICDIFSDFLEDDPRKWDKKAKFTEAEAHILLLKYLEKSLRDARTEKKRLDGLEETLARVPQLPNNLGHYSEDGLSYARVVNNRSLDFCQKAVKIYRKKVREIKKSPQYLWEQICK